MAEQPRLSHGDGGDPGHQLELEATICSETVATQRSGIHISREKYFNLFNVKEDRIKLEQVIASGVTEIRVITALRTGMSALPSVTLS